MAEQKTLIKLIGSIFVWILVLLSFGIVIAVGGWIAQSIHSNRNIIGFLKSAYVENVFNFLAESGLILAFLYGFNAVLFGLMNALPNNDVFTRFFTRFSG